MICWRSSTWQDWLGRRLACERDLAVLFTEHDMGTLFATADQVLVLNRGALIAQGSVAEIWADTRVRAVYLGEEAGAV
ncbi:MAG: hypothetical protein EXR09_01800 [Acetobacteraceae bacterium]|nr:hypothetical protein [Acetobacteraceae bacterium]